MRTVFVIAAFGFLLITSAQDSYGWCPLASEQESIIERIPAPGGSLRVKCRKGSWGYWLRRLPLKKKGAKVHDYQGKELPDQTAHVAVIDLDLSKRNLQQCADTIIRLRTEYLFERRHFEQFAFHFTSGDLARYVDWRNGMRPTVHGNRVDWSKRANPDSSRKAFRSYLETVFMYAGTHSLAGESKRVKSIRQIQIGDFFVKGGSPGHAMLVVDVCLDRKSGKKRFLLLQGFMPAQEAHIVRNPNKNLMREPRKAYFVNLLGDTTHILTRFNVLCVDRRV